MHSVDSTFFYHISKNWEFYQYWSNLLSSEQCLLTASRWCQKCTLISSQPQCTCNWALTKANWLIPGIVAFVCDQAEKMSILFWWSMKISFQTSLSHLHETEITALLLLLKTLASRKMQKPHGQFDNISTNLDNFSGISAAVRCFLSSMQKCFCESRLCWGKDNPEWFLKIACMVKH